MWVNIHSSNLKHSSHSVAFYFSNLSTEHYKLILSAGSIEVTNDGATILRAVGVDNPAAKVLVEMSRVQDSEVGDGTTSVTVLASELIREAEKLVEMRIHPQTIIAGWRKASAAAKEALEKSATDHSKDEKLFREDLMNIARTTLSSKILSQHKDFFSKLAVDAVMRLKGSGNLDAIQITKIQGGTLEESFLDEGEEAVHFYTFEPFKRSFNYFPFRG